MKIFRNWRDTFEAFQNGTLEDVKGFCAVADLQTIEKQDYILTPGRYVGIEEQEEDSEPFDEKMARLTLNFPVCLPSPMNSKQKFVRSWGRLVMKSNWRAYPLGEITELVIDYRGKTPKNLVAIGVKVAIVLCLQKTLRQVT